MKLSARPLALATISFVWAHEIIKVFAHLATVKLLSCKRFISSFNLNLSTYIVDPFYLGALFRQNWFCTLPGGKLTTWVEKFKCLDIELSINSGVDLGKKIYRVWRNFKLSIKWKVYLDLSPDFWISNIPRYFSFPLSYSHWYHILWFSMYSIYFKICSHFEEDHLLLKWIYWMNSVIFDCHVDVSCH